MTSINRLKSINHSFTKYTHQKMFIEDLLDPKHIGGKEGREKEREEEEERKTKYSFGFIKFIVFYADINFKNA